MTLSPDQDLLHYRLVDKIGEGGMGVVWKALDTSLEREVAIKVLPEAFADDAQRLARFEREAKLLASLNHPNVATVYGVHVVDNIRFLAMELVPGEDLAERLKRGPLKATETVHIAGQVADGLEAAHARGVIHRDLKPANVRVTPDGVVKILDFGLAKEQVSSSPGDDVSQSPTMTRVGSEAGVLLGTLAYMSPEQARGQEVDQRTDVWAFGCVLWECLTGKVLFGGATLSDTIGAILHTEPEWNRLPPVTPSSVRRALARCLAKSPRQRLHSIADARIELEGDELDPPGEAPARRVGNMLVLAGVTFGLVVGAAIALMSGWRPTPDATANPLADARFTRITNFQGSESDAAISPDGRFVAFVSDRDGPYDAFVGQIGLGEFRGLTEGTFGSPQDTVRNLGFHGNGSEIWLSLAGADGIQSVPLMGGSMRNFLGEHIINVQWSPDGERIAYHDNLEGDPLYVADSNGTNRRLILGSAEGMHQHFPMWAVDGQWIYLVRGRQTTGEMDLWRVRPNGDDPEQLTQDKLDARYPTPLDERTILYVAHDADGSGPWLWAIDVEAQVSRRASVGLEQFSSLSASADRRRLVATVQEPRATLWSVPLLDRVATESDAERLEDIPSPRALAPRFSASALFYLSSRGSGDGLWRLENGRVTEIWRGSETALLEPAAVSPDGNSVAILLRQNDGAHVHVLSADGAQLRPLSGSVDATGAAAWSPDGKFVVTEGTEDGARGLYKIAVDSGSAVRLVDGEALNPVWSPLGELIVYEGTQLGGRAPLRGVTPEGQPVELPTQIEVVRGGERVRFLPDGSGLIYLARDRTVSAESGSIDSISQDFWLLDLETKKSRQLARLSQDLGRVRTFDVSPDGKRIVFDRLRIDSDIVLIERNLSR